MHEETPTKSSENCEQQESTAKVISLTIQLAALFAHTLASDPQWKQTKGTLFEAKKALVHAQSELYANPNHCSDETRGSVDYAASIIESEEPPENVKIIEAAIKAMLPMHENAKSAWENLRKQLAQCRATIQKIDQKKEI